jgi:hypothetical protein
MPGLASLRSLFDPSAQQEPDAIALPDEIKRRRLMAQALMQQAGDTSPVKSGWEGLGRVVDGLHGGIVDYQTRQSERAGQEAGKGIEAKLAGLFGGGSPAASSMPAMPVSAEAGGMGSGIGAGGLRLVDRSFPALMIDMIRRALAKSFHFGMKMAVLTPCPG